MDAGRKCWPFLVAMVKSFPQKRGWQENTRVTKRVTKKEEKGKTARGKLALKEKETAKTAKGEVSLGSQRTQPIRIKCWPPEASKIKGGKMGCAERREKKSRIPVIKEITCPPVNKPRERGV